MVKSCIELSPGLRTRSPLGWFRKSCTIVLWLAFSALTTVAGQEPVEKPVPAKQEPPVADPSLIMINEFKIQLGDEGAAFRTALQGSFTELINPFTVRKRGRTYGSVYEFHRNDNFDARNFFDPVGRKLPEYKRNQFGGSFGVLVSDRLTLFGTYDGLRINKGSTVLSHIPTTDMKSGNFGALSTPLTDPLTGKAFENNRIPADRIHPVASRMLSTIPDPNQTDPFRNFLNNLPSISNADTFSGRVDYEFGSDSKLFANYNFSNTRGVEVASLPLFSGNTKGREQNVSIEYTRNFNENLVASLELAFSREAEQQLSDQAGRHGLLSSLGIKGLSTIDDVDEGYPSFDISGYIGLGGDTDWPTTVFYNSYEIVPAFTLVHGRHTVALNAEIVINQINNTRTGATRRGEFEFTGDLTGDAFADFLLGLPAVAQRGVGSDRADLRQKTWMLSIRDDWKISSRFTLSTSLAYNYVPFYMSLHDNVATFAPLLFEPPQDGKIVVTGSEEASAFGLEGLEKGQSTYPDRNDWAPGVGLAYSPLGNNRLVIRSSYQVRYNPPDGEDAFDYIGRNYPFFYTERAESREGEPDLDLGDPFRSATATELNIRAIEPHFRNPLVQNWQLYLQYEFLQNWNLEIGYTGEKYTRGKRETMANVPLPGPGDIRERRPNPAFGHFNLLTSSGSSSENRLRMAVEKRFSRGFSLQSDYEWRRMFDDATHDPSNPRNLRAERSPGNHGDHELTLNYIYDLPLGRSQKFAMEWAGKMRWIFEGWRVSGITTFSSGDRFTPRYGGDVNNDGVRFDRPDRIGSAVLDSSRRSVDHWFATSDFADPPYQYGFGNSGRNVLLAPNYRNWDISFIKRTRVTDGGSLLEFRVQLFNAFNHANFQAPKSTFGTAVFGKIFGAENAREIELALKYSF
jgi:hypothetical protein